MSQRVPRPAPLQPGLPGHAAGPQADRADAGQGL